MLPLLALHVASCHLPQSAKLEYPQSADTLHVQQLIVRLFEWKPRSGRGFAYTFQSVCVALS